MPYVLPINNRNRSNSSDAGIFGFSGNSGKSVSTGQQICGIIKIMTF